MVTKKQLLVDKLISNNDYLNKKSLLKDTLILYKKLRANFYTTELFALLDSYDLKEDYLKKYNLDLYELYYNVGIVGKNYEHIYNKLFNKNG